MVPESLAVTSHALHVSWRESTCFHQNDNAHRSSMRLGVRGRGGVSARQPSRSAIGKRHTLPSGTRGRLEGAL